MKFINYEDIASDMVVIGFGATCDTKFYSIIIMEIVKTFYGESIQRGNVIHQYQRYKDWKYIESDRGYNIELRNMPTIEWFQLSDEEITRHVILENI